MRIRRWMILMILLCAAAMPAAAQTSDVTVPDLLGLNAPQAAAALNALGLWLGEDMPLLWVPDTGLPENSIAAQSIPAGTQVAPGTRIDITVLRAANMAVIYDDNDLTVVNLNTTPVDLGALTFADISGQTAFSATRISGDVRGGSCVQVWSVARSVPKQMADCEGIQRWLVTNNRAEHFWTQENGIQQFTIFEDGVPLTVCPAAPIGSIDSPLRCDFFYGGGSSGGNTADYLYFAYTPEAIALINMSQDRWMLTGITPIYNYNPALQIRGVELRFGDTQLFSPDTQRRPGQIERLAPGQCIVFTTTPLESDAAPQDCIVIAQRALDPSVAFWTSADFEVESVTTGRRRACPAAIPEQPTLCILPL